MLSTHCLAVLCALLAVTVAQQQNRQPKFTNEQAVRNFFQTGIEENLPVSGLPVIQLSCEDPDGNMIQYGALRTSSVRIGLTDGNIYFTRPLDYEQSVNSNNQNEKANSVTFTCQDYDENFIPLSEPALLAITITVIDKNDNLPTFSVQSAEGYTLPISEDAEVGTTLMPLLSIFDADQGANARLYSLEFECNTPEEQEGCQHFDVGYNRIAEQNYTVFITLKDRLDYEQRTFYKLSLVAVDGEGSDAVPHLTSSVGVRITVDDSQDTNPIFTNQNLAFDLNEGIRVGELVSFTISARDGDLGAKRPVEIELIDDGVDLFRAEPSTQTDIERGIYASRLSVRSDIDRESPEIGASYQFTARAIELDSNGARTTATATAQFTARILDIDDNGPEFAQNNYYVEVQEMDGMSGTIQIPNLKIDVSDPDEPSNARFKVDVSTQSSQGAFSLTPDQVTTGTASFYLTVNSFVQFDYDEPAYRRQIVTLTAVEIDKDGSGNDIRGTKSSSATVTVVLTDTNDNAPEFTQTSYRGTIIENAPVGTTILRIQATDDDEGVNGDLRYSIADRVTTVFSVNRTSGHISLAGPLDFETQSSYSFLAYAEDISNKPITSQVQVTIEVLDYNDIGPQFDLPTYSGQVAEGSLNFESAVIVEAYDPADPEAVITYSIVGGNTPTNSFVIDPRTGELSLREALDYEAIPNGGSSYVLDVRASDNGQPALTTDTKITISVLDENDHSPAFQQRQYSKTISEAEPPGTTLLTVSAVDDDAGSNGHVTYRIGSGARDNFVIDSNGNLLISNNPNFDYDLVKSYQLQIIATDGGSPQESDTATVFITVTDANNKDPYFLKNLYTAVIPESSPVGTTVVTVQADDDDSQNQLQYSIIRPSITAINRAGAQIGSTFPYDFRELFEMESTSGVIKVAAALDRDFVVEVSFVIKVQDIHPSAIGEQTATSRVTITISGTLNTDLFFNLPWTKQNPQYEVGILESVPINTEIITLQARDPVSGGRVVSNYEEVSEPEGGNFFEIGRTSGIVYLKEALDYERGDRVHSVVVRATEGTRSVTATVRILVEDENDNSPAFTQPEYSFRVSENAKYPYKVGVITAFDPDTTTFGPIEYTLKGLDSGDFVVFDSLTGNVAEILVADELDFETRDEYVLDMIATDNKFGQGFAIRNQARATVRIIVVDENDNTPDFADQNRTFSVAETAPTGTRLGQVLAKDGDFGLNGLILYTMRENPNVPIEETRFAMSHFTVTSSTAIVQTQDSLRGAGGIYRFYLVATDQGSPPKSAFIPITVKVQGAEDDDGTPRWDSPINNYVAEVFEHEPGAIVPVVISAVPRTPQASTLYRFSGTLNEYENFTIDPNTGDITVTKDLDREIKEFYTLVIVAQDSINTTLISRRTLIVRLKDKNDNKPSFKKKYDACPVDFEVPTVYYADDNTPKDMIVAHVEACDPDGPANSRMDYSLYLGNSLCLQENSEAFVVLTNGSIQSTKMLDYEERAEYLVCVEVKDPTFVEPPQRKKRAFDTGLMSPNDTVAYIVIRIRDINDHSPVFPVDSVVAVLQTTPSSSVVTKVTAIDADGPLHNRVAYRIGSTMYYPDGGGEPYTLDTAFKINPNTGIVSTNLPSYDDFADGYFILNIIAQDYESSTFSDSMQLKIIVHRRSQILRVVLNMDPSAGRELSEQLIRDLNSVDSRIQFYFLTASEHRTVDAPVGSQTDICFVMVQNNVAYEASSGVGMLDSRYDSVLGTDNYKMVDRGSCFPLRSSADSVKWQDLWWVLVAIAIFIFICCIILLVTICILFDRYKSYMNTQRTYMVPQ